MLTNSRSSLWERLVTNEPSGLADVTDRHIAFASTKLACLAHCKQFRRYEMKQVDLYDAEILATCSELIDFRLFKSFPSAATVYAPRLLAAFGEDRNCFKNTSEVQRGFGVASVTERSGKQS